MVDSGGEFVILSFFLEMEFFHRVVLVVFDGYGEGRRGGVVRRGGEVV